MNNLLKWVPGALLLLVGCSGVLDTSDSVPISTGEIEFMIDSSQWITDREILDFPGVTCDDDLVCMNYAFEVCAGACVATCEQTVCHYEVPLTLFQTIWLSDENEALGDYGELEGVHLDSVTFAISENTFSDDLEPVEIWLGAQTSLSVPDPDAQEIGETPLVPAKSTLDPISLEVASTGRFHAEQLLQKYKTPFNILLVGSLKWTAGEKIPTGAITGSLELHSTGDVGVD